MDRGRGGMMPARSRRKTNELHDSRNAQQDGEEGGGPQFNGGGKK